jgi:Secretion system C-terminal sorting domain
MHLLKISFRIIVTLSVFAIMVFPSDSNATEWDLFNTDTLTVYNHLCSTNLVESMDAFCTEEGFMYMEEGVWVINDDMQMRIVDAIQYDDERILVAIGYGTDSDGVYWYYPATNNFDLIQYIYWPGYIHKHEDSGTYYIGNYYSTDCITWTEDVYWPENEVMEMASFDEHLVMTISGSFGVPTVLNKEYGETDWSSAAQGSPSISSVSFNEENGILYGCCYTSDISPGLWQSFDYGVNWELITDSDNPTMVYWQWGKVFVAFDETNENGVVGMWDSDNSEFIYMDGENLPDTRVHSFSVNEYIDCENIIVCTADGAYTTCEIPTTHVDEDGYYPEEFEVSAYPNPFNPTTNISINLHEQAEVIVSVYNINGRLVKTLAEASLDAGSHELLFDGSSITSGIYLVQVSTSEFSQVQKVVLLK